MAVRLNEAAFDHAKALIKAHYKFPYGDFEKLHCCRVLATRIFSSPSNDVAPVAMRRSMGLRRGFWT